MLQLSTDRRLNGKRERSYENTDKQDPWEFET